MGKSSANNRKLENALDYSIKLLNSDSTVQECLKLYPNNRKELKGLLVAANNLRHAYPGYPELRPSKLYAKTSREKFLDLVEGGSSLIAHELDRVSDSSRHAPFDATAIFRNYAVAASVALVLFLSVAGLIHVSGNSLPGSPLYGIKRAVENVQLALTFDSESRERLRREFEKRRMAEAKQMEKEKMAVLGYRLENAQAKKKDMDFPGNNQEADSEAGVAEARSGHGGSGSSKPTNSRRGYSRNTEPRARVVVNEPGDSGPDYPEYFEVGGIATSADHISPNGDGEYDILPITVSNASSAEFDVGLYKGSTRAYVIARQTAGKNLNFEWAGRDIYGNRIPDGEYVIRVADRWGHVAGVQAEVVVASLKEIKLVKPIGDIKLDDYGLTFVWEEGDEEYTYRLQLVSDGNPDNKITRDGLRSSGYQPDNELIEKLKLEQGSWKWRIMATNARGEVAVSEYSKFKMLKAPSVARAY